MASTPSRSQEALFRPASGNDTTISFTSKRHPAWIKALKTLFGDADEYSLTESEAKKGQGKGTAYKIKPKTAKTNILTVTFYKTDTVLIQGPKKQVDEFESTTFHQFLHLIDTATPPEPFTPTIQKAQPNQDISPASTVTPASIRENTISPSMFSADYPDRVPVHQPLRNDEETLDGLLKSVSKSPTSENVFRCHIKRLQIRADNIEGEMIKIDDKQKQFASSIQGIVAEGIEKGLSDLKKDITTHILSLLKAQHVDRKTLSESIDTLTAEVRSNFSTNNLSHNDPRLEQAK